MNINNPNGVVHAQLDAIEEIRRNAAAATDEMLRGKLRQLSKVRRPGFVENVVRRIIDEELAKRGAQCEFLFPQT